MEAVTSGAPVGKMQDEKGAMNRLALAVGAGKNASIKRGPHMYEMQGPRWPYGALTCQFPNELTLHSRPTSERNPR
jgi:hypothetical protein